MLQDYPADRVLVCLRYGIGDVVMEMPVLEALRRALPEARITALGAPPATELLEGSGLVDEVVSLARWGFRHRWCRGAADAREELHRWLDGAGFDLFLDVHHVTPVVGEVVWGRGIRSLEADEAVEAAVVGNGGDGVSAIRAAVAVGWGLEVPEGEGPRLQVDPAAKGRAVEFLRRHGFDRSPVALSPVASSALKRWPLERLATVADRLLEQGEERLLLLEGPQDGIARELLGAMRGSERVERAGPLHLKEVAALLATCRALVCNDTGLMHMAAALRVPTVAVFGPTPPGVYRPPARCVTSVGGEDFHCPHRNTLSLHPPQCFAVDACLTEEQGCIRRAGVEQVWAALQEVMERKRPELPVPLAR